MSEKDYEPYLPADIKVLSVLEAVRKRPAMYVGDLDAPDLVENLVKEVFCHAIDEMVGGGCNDVHFYIKYNYCIITYNSPMSLKTVGSENETIAYRMVSSLAGCSNLKKNIDVGDEYCKLGLAVLNAMSDHFICYVREKERSAYYAFSKGVLEGPMKDPQDMSWCRDDSYTKISFRLDPDLIPNCTFEDISLEKFIEELSDKFPEVRFKYERHL